MGGPLVRCIGIVSAKAEIGPKNLSYSIYRHADLVYAQAAYSTPERKASMRRKSQHIDVLGVRLMRGIGESTVPKPVTFRQACEAIVE